MAEEKENPPNNPPFKDFIDLEAERTTPEAIKPESKPEFKKDPYINPTQRRKNIFVSSLKWWAFFILLIVVGVFALHYVYPSTVKPASQKTKAAIVRAEVKTTPGVVIPQNPVPVVAPVEDNTAQLGNMHSELGVLNEKVDKVAEQNKNMFIYFSARDLREALDDKTKFARELDDLRGVIGDDPEVTGRLDILQQSSQNGLVTKDDLIKDLKNVEAKVSASINTGFRGHVETALGGLIKVSKVEGEVSETDYESIIRRANINLSKNNLTPAEFKATIAEMNKLGAPASAWVQKAYNRQRIMEVTEELVEYSKAKILKQ